jgi:membrane dipeptidase
MTADQKTPIRHEDLLVIDGLVFLSDGSADALLAGNVAAVNLTVVNPLSDFDRAVDETLVWQRRAAAADSPWLPVRNADDILAARQAGKVGLIMGWQNTRPIGDRLDRIGFFHSLGTRVMQLTYNEANLLGDGCLEPRNAGLSRLGCDAVAEMNAVGVAIDLSHCGEQTTLDAVRHSRKPVLLTHANASAVAKSVRNKSDAVLRAVADGGGIVGLSLHGFMNWSGDPKRPPSLEGFVEQARYICNLVGDDHVGMGNDYACVRSPEVTADFLRMTAERYPGASADFIAAFGNSLAGRFPKETPTPREIGRVTVALDRAGFSSRQIEGIMGQNLLRALREIWS